MQQLPKESLRIVHINPDDENDIPKSEIWLNGAATGKFVFGAFLEAAISWSQFFLLFTTDDCPFEEMLGIRLFDKNFNLIDSATLGYMYSTGTFSEMILTPPNSIHFNFIGDIRWELELLENPIFCLPIFSDPFGVWRKFKFKKHFKIVGRPLPQGQNLLRRRAENREV